MVQEPQPPRSHETSGVRKVASLLPLGTTVGLAVAVLAVFFITLFSFRALQSREQAAIRVTSALRSIEVLESVSSTLKDAETGQRGYLLVGDESYLEPFVQAKGQIESELRTLRQLAEDQDRLRRLSELEKVLTLKLTELQETVDLRRENQTERALAIVRTNRGKAAMDQLRVLIDQLQVDEHEKLDERQREWRAAVVVSTQVTWAGASLLLLCIVAAAIIMSRDYRARERQQWLQLSQMALGERLQGEQRLAQLGENVLQFLAPHLQAQLGTMHIVESEGSFRRFAGYALPAALAQHPETTQAGEGLLGEALKSKRVTRIRDLPADYFTVESSLGSARVRELILAPAVHEGVVQAVIELGFFRPVQADDLTLLTAASEAIGIAVRSAKDRTRLEELLQETQRQGEELQAQQEELRVSNEELEEQARVLQESQVRLENQQAELEQINSQLEEQAQTLETQKDELAMAQGGLEERAAELVRANRYKSEFLANMSHELRTPLNSSLILAKLLADNKDGNLTPEQVRFAHTISSAGNDLLALINDILDLSRIEAGQLELRINAVPVSPMLDDLFKTLQPIANEKGLSLVSAIGSDVPERMVTDAQRLNQILKNLLANALKFTERGSVSLTVAALSPGLLTFTVKDTGIGIPHEQQRAIFDAFRQVDGSSHRKYGGTGLGLSISRDLARRLGGDISVQSTEGAGSTFTLTIPERHDAPPAAVPRQDALAVARPAPLARALSPVAAAPRVAPRPVIGVDDDRERLVKDARTILVIEDDQHFAAVLRDLARERGYRCIVTHTASEGLAAVKKYPVMAVLLDMNLPDHSGLSVLDQLKNDSATRHIPVHVLSVDDFSQQAMALGAVGYVMKPAKHEEVVGALKKLEQKFSQALRRVLVVEDDARQRESVRTLLSVGAVEIVEAATGGEALAQLQASTFDCMVMDLALPDFNGFQLLEQMSAREDIAFPPVIVYTGRSLSADEEQQLRRFSQSIIIKDARSPERLLDEVTLFLHQMEAQLPPDRQRMLRDVRNRDAALEGKRVLVVEDDVRNVFALTSLLEPKGAKIEIARNGKEALNLLRRTSTPETAIDLVLMDLMMPEMDGLTCMREIRKDARFRKLPIIALTAKAMKDDQQQSLSAGANDYIAKPLDVEKLLSLVRVWMPK